MSSELSVMVVDDEPSALRGLVKILGRGAGLRVVETARSGGEALEKISRVTNDRGRTVRFLVGSLIACTRKAAAAL